MPTITPEILDHPLNRFILAEGHNTLREALYRLQAKPEGREWWVLLVILEDGTFLAARFNAFRPRIEAEGDIIFDTPLAKLGAPLARVETVTLTTDLNQARELASQSDAKLVVVLSSSNGSHVVGIINIGGDRRASADFDKPSLVELAGIGERQEATPSQPETEPTRAGGASPSKPEPPAAPPPMPAPAPQAETADREISVSIDGNVKAGGQVIVAGDDVNITHIHTTTEEKTSRQERRFEAAFPQEVHLGVEEKLFVAVMLPDAPSPFAQQDKPQVVEATDRVGIDMPIDRETGQLKPVEIEVSVTATGFKIKGADKKSLTVWPDGSTAQRWFLLEPEEEGKQSILIELTHKGRLLDEISLQTEVFAPTKKPRSALNLALKVASFSLQFSFTAG